MKLARLLACLSFALAAACGEDEPAKNYDEELLAQYRAALPSRSQLAEDPTATARAVGDPAMYPHLMVGGVEQVNGMVLGILSVLDVLKTIPPTVYNSAEQKFLWGPWDNDNGYGKVVAYIEKAPEEADFDYHYAFARVASEDQATWWPVIFGGATPIDPDHGVGVTMWDFEMNRAWEAAYDPNYDAAAARTLGRFVALYGSVADAARNFQFNLALFRNFLPEDAALGAQPVDLDFYYGRGTGTDGNTLSFLDWQLTSNVCDAQNQCFEQATAGSPQDELTRIRLAFVNEGTGKAEATVSGGDLTVTVTAEECWGQFVDSRYLAYQIDAGTPYVVHGQEEAGCGPIFSQPLDVLGVPAIDMTDPAYTAMDCAATFGMGAPECAGL